MRHRIKHRVVRLFLDSKTIERFLVKVIVVPKPRYDFRKWMNHVGLRYDVKPFLFKSAELCNTCF